MTTGRRALATADVEVPPPVPAPAEPPEERAAAGGPSGERTAAGPRLRELDLLRFVAALVVLLHHLAGQPRPMWGGDAREIFPEIKPISHFGYLGVDLFFVISGFVILMSGWDRRPADFLRSRVARLFPAYWFAVLLAMAVYLAFDHSYGVDNGNSHGTLERFLPNLTMLQAGVGAPHMEVSYWTLWVELHFYSLILLLVWQGVDYARCIWFMGGWLLLGAFAKEADHELLSALLIVDWAPYFIAGMALFLIHRFGQNLALWLLVAFCWALACHYRVQGIANIDRWPGVHEWLIPLVITGIFAVMGLVALGGLRFLRWRRLTVVGAVTYPVYLVHETVSRPVIHELGPHLGPWTVLGVAVLTTIMVAYLIHELVEKPLSRMLSARLKQAAGQIRAQSRAAR